MAIDLSPIHCPSCYRRGDTTMLPAHRVTYPLPLSGEEQFIYVYECPVCSYTTTQHQVLFHEYRVRYNRALNVLLRVRGWVKSKTNTPPGIIRAVNRAVEMFMKDMGLSEAMY